MRKDSPTESSLWKEQGLNAIKFSGVRLSFPEYLLGDYKSIYNKPSLKLSNLKENHLLRVLLMEHADKEKHAHIENEMRSKLMGYQGDLAKGSQIIEILQKDKGAIMNKLWEV